MEDAYGEKADERFEEKQSEYTASGSYKPAGIERVLRFRCSQLRLDERTQAIKMIAPQHPADPPHSLGRCRKRV